MSDVFDWKGLKPMDLVLFCPNCKLQHLDVGEWHERPHRTHLCETTPLGYKTGCGHEWQQLAFPTRGVPFVNSELAQAAIAPILMGMARRRIGAELNEWDQFEFMGFAIGVFGVPFDQATALFARWTEAIARELNQEILASLADPNTTNDIIENLKRIGWTPPPTPTEEKPG